jgi:hypothetical protein
MSVPDDGGGSSGPFEHYDVTAEAVWSAGDSVGSYAGDVEALQGDVVGAHRTAQAGVAGLLEGPMAAAPQPVKDRTAEWMQSALFGGGAIRLWGDGIQEYNRGIDDLNRRYWEAKGNNFGQTRTTLPDDASATDRQQADAEFGDAVADADAAMLAALRRERDERLVPALDEDAQHTAGLLDRGPADGAAVLALYQAGALPLVSPVAFPGVDFGRIDPALLYQNLLRNGQLPPGLESMSEDELVDWFRDHPDDANMAALLLTVPSLTGNQTTVVRALGRYDAWVVSQGLATPPGRAGLDQIGTGSQRLNEINGRLANGERLTAAERAYLDSWFNGVGADGLAALPRYVDDAAAAEMPAGLPSGYVTDAVLGGYRRDYLAPVADAIMNLSDPDKGGVHRMDEMPQAVRDLANTPIGAIDEHTGLRWAAVDEDGDPVEEWDDQGYPDGTRVFRVAGMERFGGFVDLLEQSTVDGGDEFTRELGETALRVKQDLNAVAANETDALRFGPGSERDYTALRLATFDDQASDLLSVVSRNEDGSSLLFVNDDDRRMLLGMNWYDDDGAIDVIRAGTDRDPAGGGGGMAQAMATQELMTELGGDRDFYLGRMTEGMEDAAVDTGINWMDTFGRPATSDTPTEVGHYDDALGRERLGVQLSAADRANFLQFVSGTGIGSDGNPDGDAMRFRGASVTYSEQLVADALQTGNANTVDSALATAGRIDGAITAGDYEYHLDRTGDEHDEAQAAYEAAKNRNWGYALASKVGVTIVSQGINVATGGAAGPYTAVAGAVINPLIDQVFDAGDPPVDQTPRTREELFGTDRNDYTARRNYFLLSAYERAGIVPPPGQDTGDYGDLYSGGHLVDYDTVVRDSDLINQVRSAQDAAQHQWEADHHGAGINVAENYDAERNGIANGSYWHDEPHNSAWDDDDTARRRLYGEHYVGDGDVDDLFEDRVPADPDDYYDPDRD